MQETVLYLRLLSLLRILLLPALPQPEPDVCTVRTRLPRNLPDVYKRQYQVCREIRHTSDVPIIMLSAKGETFDKVLGLELGAYDYIIKPVDSKELVARVRAVLRRFHVKSSSAAPKEKCVSYPDLVINLTNYSAVSYTHLETE